MTADGSTGRYWYVVEGDDELLTEEPAPPLFAAKWTEYRDEEDGELYYVSDHEGYTLTAEEFGPIPSDDDEYVVMECESPDCEIKDRHWTVYHRETGAGVSDHFSEREARRACDCLLQGGPTNR